MSAIPARLVRHASSLKIYLLTASENNYVQLSCRLIMSCPNGFNNILLEILTVSYGIC